MIPSWWNCSKNCGLLWMYLMSVENYISDPRLRSLQHKTINPSAIRKREDRMDGARQTRWWQTLSKRVLAVIYTICNANEAAACMTQKTEISLQERSDSQGICVFKCAMMVLYKGLQSQKEKFCWAGSGPAAIPLIADFKKKKELEWNRLTLQWCIGLRYLNYH